MYVRRVRDELTSAFRRAVGRLPEGYRVGIVGGGLSEPEWVSLELPSKNLVLMNFEPEGFEREKIFDANEVVLSDKFQLVICNQVLEHLWNHAYFFDSMAGLLAKKGMVWISVPASNFVHGSPEYYSAGFTDSYLQKNLEKRGLRIMAQGQICSRRAYLARHVFGVWPKGSWCSRPLIGIRSAFKSTSPLSVKLKWSMLLLLLSAVPENCSPRWAVESWVLASKE